MPLKKGTLTVAQKMDKVGIDPICELIASGETFANIGNRYGVGAVQLMEWLTRPDNAKKTARAREFSAEAWLDKGLDVVYSSLSKSGDVDPSAARAYAQECARRAAIRNRAYGDRVVQEHTGADGGPIQTINANVELTREQLIEQAKLRGLPTSIFIK